MITATIGSYRFVINKLEDAEALLRIFNSAKQVNREYDIETRNHTFVEEARDASIEVAVYNDQPILTPEEYAAQQQTKSVKAA